MDREITFEPAERPGCSLDVWPVGTNEVSLFVKFASDSAPRLVKALEVSIGPDQMGVLTTDSTVAIPVSSYYKFQDWL